MPPSDATANPKGTAQCNHRCAEGCAYTDPDSHILKGGDGWIQGYCSTGNIETCEQRKLDAYVSTSRQQHGKRPRCSSGPNPWDLDARGRMDRKLHSKAGQAI